jgi:hypothetical protein
LTAGCAVATDLVAPEVSPTAKAPRDAGGLGLRTVFADLRFWRLARFSVASIGTAWSLQGLWAAQWLTDFEGLDRGKLLRTAPIDSQLPFNTPEMSDRKR